MDPGAKEELRALVLRDIETVAKCMDRAQGIIHDTGWGSSRKHAESVSERMLTLRQDLVDILYELRDCIRDDEVRE